jgi:hypothetical protein
MFTDVEGSTRLWAEDSDAMSASLLVHDDIVRGVVEEHGGYVFSTAGDSFAAAFARASTAVDAASDLQAALTGATWPGPELRVRIGLHLGEAEERGGDYFGPAVNTTARVHAAGHGGQTLLTEVVRVASRRTGTVDLGLHRLRDVDEPVHLHQLGDADFPPLRAGDRHAAASPAADLPKSWLVVNEPGRVPSTVPLSNELTVGRHVGRDDLEGHLQVRNDPTVSRLHAVFVPKVTGWCVQATNATNGLFVNGSRLAPGAVHLLSTGDEMRLGERTIVTFHTDAALGDDRSSTEKARPIPDLTHAERRILLSLCAPVLDGDTFSPPSTVQDIASDLGESERSVHEQIRVLCAKFGVAEGPECLVRLANDALSCGAIRLADLRSLRELP